MGAPQPTRTRVKARDGAMYIKMDDGSLRRTSYRLRGKAKVKRAKRARRHQHQTLATTAFPFLRRVE